MSSNSAGQNRGVGPNHVEWIQQRQNTVQGRKQAQRAQWNRRKKAHRLSKRDTSRDRTQVRLIRARTITLEGKEQEDRKCGVRLHMQQEMQTTTSNLLQEVNTEKWATTQHLETRNNSTNRNCDNANTSLWSANINIILHSASGTYPSLECKF